MKITTIAFVDSFKKVYDQFVTAWKLKIKNGRGRNFSPNNRFIYICKQVN